MGTTPANWFNWSDENAALARTLYARGYSASLIAKELNAKRPAGTNSVSRNAVIGKLNRLGLTQATRSEPSAPKRRNPKTHVVTHLKRSEPRARKPGSGNSDASVIALNFQIWRAPKTSGNVPEVQPDVDDLPFVRPWETRIAGECKWPFGPPDATLSCCRPVERSDYCAKHANTAFQPRSESQKRGDAKMLKWLAKRAA